MQPDCHDHQHHISKSRDYQFKKTAMMAVHYNSNAAAMVATGFQRQQHTHWTSAPSPYRLYGRGADGLDVDQHNAGNLMKMMLAACMPSLPTDGAVLAAMVALTVCWARALPPGLP
jgi:hypothetical protein